MKKLLAKLRTKSFWAQIGGVLTLLLARLGVADASAAVNAAVEAAGAILVLLGAVTSPAAPAKKPDDGEKEEK